MENKTAKDMLLEDALQVAIENEKKNIKYERIIIFETIVIIGLIICLMLF